MAMPKLVSRIRHWWRASPPPAVNGVPYRVVCNCGHVVTGLRQPRFQVVPCPACRQEVFILPINPLPLVATDSEKQAGQAGAPAAASRRRDYLPAALVAMVAVGMVSVAGLIVFSLLGTNTPPDGAADALPSERRGGVSQQVQQARLLMGRGEFYRAAAEARAALGLLEQQPGSVSPAERSAAAQLHAEAALLAELSVESLEEMLRHGAGLPEPEWQEAFRDRYRHKAIVLDTEVRRTPEGRYRHGYLIFAAGEKAELILDDLAVLRSLPLEQPRRLLFGARLHSATRARAGGWEVRLEPDSGVLLTEPAVALYCPPLGDAAARDVLARQRAWVLGEPEKTPAPPK